MKNNVKAGEWRYDLHLHTDASTDCKTSLTSLITVARRRGLAGIAVTDHDTMDGVKRLQDFWPHEQLHLIPGCERTLQDGSHLIGLFLHEPPRASTPHEAVEEILAQGGMVYVPHPFRAYSGILGIGSRISAEDQKWVLEQSHIIEIFNSKCTAEENRQALELLEVYPRAFAASSDAHFAHEVGRACTAFAARLETTDPVSLAAYAPPAAAAARLAKLRRAGSSPGRKAVRQALESIRLLQATRTVRNHFRCYLSPDLEKYL